MGEAPAITTVDNIDINQQLDPRLESVRQLKNAFTGIAGNSINYVATLLSSYYESSPEAYTAALAETSDNLFSAITERFIARHQGESNYELYWRDTDDGLRLQSQFGFIDSLLDESLISTQVTSYDFEYARAIENKRFYEKLVTARASGYQGSLVEFSPSPPLTEQAKERGYEGNDSIFIYSFNDGVEVVNQYWFPSNGNYNDYQQLLQELKIEVPQETNLTDTDIMSFSREIGSSDHEAILRFIQERRRTSLTESESREIATFLETDIRRQIQETIIPSIEAEAARIFYSADFNADEDCLLLIIEEIWRQQYRLDAFLKGIREQQPTLASFDLLDKEEQLLRMQQENYVLKGCGFSYGLSRDKSVGVGFQTQSITFAPQGQELMYKDEVICPSCGYKFKVKNGDPSTYKSSCPNPLGCSDPTAINC